MARKTAAQLDREIAHAVSYVDPARYGGGIVMANTDSPWRGTAILNHFATGAFSHDPNTNRYYPEGPGRRPLIGAVSFSVDSINGKFPRKGTSEMKHLERAWKSRRKLAAFVKGLDKRNIRLDLKPTGDDQYQVTNYDTGRHLGTVTL